MKVTRVAFSDRLNAGKYAALGEPAVRLGRVRSLVWQRYGSVAGAGLRDRQVRDRWLAEGTHHQIDAATMKTSHQPCGGAVIGVDKGYTEVLTDSDGNHHGTRLGALLTAESDYRKAKGRAGPGSGPSPTTRPSAATTPDPAGS